MCGWRDHGQAAGLLGLGLWRGAAGSLRFIFAVTRPSCQRGVYWFPFLATDPSESVLVGPK